MFDVARRDLTQEAREIAIERVNKFEMDLIPKMEKIEGAINHFADPDFQFVLTSAHKTAASTNKDSDYAMLTELLIHRVQKDKNKVTCAGVNRAIEIVDDISDEALIGLTVGFAVQQYIPVTGNISEGLDTLNQLFEKIGVDNLPKGIEWLDHLDVLDAIRLSTISSLKKYEQYIPERMPGYFVEGIKKDSEEYQKIEKMLRDNGIPCTIMCEHEFNESFCRLDVVSKEHIEDIYLIYNIKNKEGQEQSVQKELSQEQKEVLCNIYDMSVGNSQSKEKIIGNFSDEIEQYVALKRVREWWNSIPFSFQITSVGKVLAHANAKRIDSSLPDMS